MSSHSSPFGRRALPIPMADWPMTLTTSSQFLRLSTPISCLFSMYGQRRSVRVSALPSGSHRAYDLISARSGGDLTMHIVCIVIASRRRRPVIGPGSAEPPVARDTPSGG